ncbi:MAG: carbohydrate kinase family protein [Erysipelotrichaceae bacterium]|nr:carbohydrate kinase family protein [Erysipelotrichaceae bacterium]
MKDHKQFDCVCAGIATWDTLFTGVDRDLMSIDGILAKGYYASSGGDAVNAAVSMARLGLNTAVCASLGKDSAADLVIAELQKAGADCSYLHQSAHVHTASPVLLVDPEGERHIIRVPDNGNHFFSQDMVGDELLEKARHLHVASANVLKALDGEGLSILFARAHAKGLTTSLDASYDREGNWMKNIEGALQNCDIFIPSMQEASIYAQSNVPQEICAFFSKYPLKVFGIKLGEQGVLVTDFRNTWKMGTLYHEKPVDTTGAGDAFLAGFVAGWLKGYDIPSCAAIGSAQSYSVLGAVGANASAGTWQDAMELLEKNRIELRQRSEETV